MPENFIASQNTVPMARIVQFTHGRAFRGHLLTRQGPLMSPEFFALYTDGVVEQIDPANGTPRPVPDNADRTKFQIIPSSLQSGLSANYKTGSLFSGGIRAVVQCDHMRGEETKLSYTWGKTHGLLEYPNPRIVGVDEFEEAEARLQRRHYIIEISSLGVFAAPVTLGKDSSSYGLIKKYLPTDQQLQDFPGWQTYKNELSLWWAYTHGGHADVQRLLTASQIGPAYSSGAPWLDSIGWAFDIYGRNAANVVQLTRTDGFDFSAIEDYYETRLMELSFNVTETLQAVAIELLSPGHAFATSTAHGLSEGQLVVISGANESEYNGPHVVFNVTPDNFEFNVALTAPSPATGSVRLLNVNNDITIDASLNVGAPGKVTFRRGFGGTLWVPSGDVWAGTYPFLNLLNGSGPVHVFYDGEQQILTEWSSSVTSEPAGETPPFTAPNGGDVFWDGPGHSGIHVYTGPNGAPFFACQAGSGCMVPEYPTLIVGGFGEKWGAYTNENHGFFNSIFDLRGNGYSRSNILITTSSLGTAGTLSDTFPNLHGVCPECGDQVQCTNTYHTTTTYIGYRSRKKTIQEERDSGSVLILFPREREAVAGIQSTRSHDEGSEITNIQGQSRVGFKEENAGGDCPFTDWERADMYLPGFVGEPFPYPVPDPGFQIVNDHFRTGTFHMHTPGRTFSKALDTDAQGNVQNPDLAEFMYWLKGQHEIAQSGIFAMHGGLFHDDPSLDPPSGQFQNLVTSVDGDIVINGGFAQLNGKTVIGFVGLV